MSRFEFVTILMSFVVAFGVSEILSGWGRQFLARDRVKPCLLQILLSFLLLVALLHSLWGYWVYREVEWNFLRFLVVLLPLLVVSSIAFFVTPPMRGEKPIDMRAHYFRIHTAAYLLFAAYITLHALVELILTGGALYLGQAIRVVGVGVCVCLALSRNEVVHWSLLLAVTVLQAAFIALLTPDLT